MSQLEIAFKTQRVRIPNGQSLGTVKEQLDRFGAARSGESAVKPRACDPPSKHELSKLYLDSSLLVGAEFILMVKM